MVSSMSAPSLLGRASVLNSLMVQFQGTAYCRLPTAHNMAAVTQAMHIGVLGLAVGRQESLQAELLTACAYGCRSQARWR